jgi:MerR family transcriptional regulator, repressor of the yfmOP operon
MNVITITSDAFQVIADNIAEINKKIDNSNKQQLLSDNWLDIQEVCLLLKISKRTLQSYRDNGVLPFSQIGGKIYFKAADIEEHLNSHYVKPHKKVA